MRTSLSVVCLLVLTTLFPACKTTPEPKPEATTAVSEVKVRAPDAVLVSLKREACFGRCPVYIVTVKENGAVEFEGSKDVLTQGKTNAMLDAPALEKLKARLEGSEVATWRSSYMKRLVTDMATVHLTVRGKSIQHYLGDDSAPAELTKLEDDVDALIGTAQWVTGKGAPAL